MGSPMNVVDYDAWKRGYMPPSEHQLIDALAYRDARVVASSHVVQGEGWWIVVQGDPFESEDEWELMMFCTSRQLRFAKQRRKERETTATALMELAIQIVQDPTRLPAADQSPGT